MVAINPELRGKPYRYAYCCDMSQDVGGVLRGWSGLIKLDVVSSHHATWQAQERRSLVGDPEFVPAPTRRYEDDGWILTHVFDPVVTLSSVAIIDAKTMTLVASVRLPSPLPMGFHTNWIPSKL
jgi:carotenoid cleavage dioxygenase